MSILDDFIIISCQTCDNDTINYIKDQISPTVKLEEQVESVLEAFLATKQTRVGPLPCQESLKLMRSVISKSISQNLPIPLLIAASACKLPISSNASIDLAELFFLRTLNTLNKQVQQIYAPGLEIRVRLEDLTVLYLFNFDEKVQQLINEYSSAFKDLCTVLNYDSFITLVSESSLIELEAFKSEAAPIFQHFIQYIEATNNKPPGHEWCPQFNTLISLGWKGDVSQEMRDFIKTQYSALYPEMTGDQQDMMLCRYLTCILTRRRFNAAGDLPRWSATGRLEMTFTTQLPDCPKISTRIHYRILPFTDCKLALPFWRAKGIAKKNMKDGKIVFSLTTLDDMQWIPSNKNIVLTRKQGSNNTTVDLVHYILSR